MNIFRGRVSFKDALTQAIVEVPSKIVNLYVCGHTAYRPPHIGNMRPVVVFDLLVRVLKYMQYKVHYMRNTTDIDDKIIQAANEQHVDIATIVRNASRAHDLAEKALGCKSPDANPQATEHVPKMLEVIESLLDQGLAYCSKGHVLFRVPENTPAFYPTECCPSDDIDTSYKNHPQDFVLWKPSKDGEPVWESKYGPGRPGWHTECVAMILSHSNNLTIHGGGCDLKFPHHANELLQLCQFDCQPKIWMHSGMLIDSNGKKMSKSLGNTLDALELAKKIPGAILRIALLSTRYSHPLPWTKEKFLQAEKIWIRILNLMHADTTLYEDLVPQLFVDALIMDLNTPEAFTQMLQAPDHQIIACAKFLGILDASAVPVDFAEDQVKAIIAEYHAARAIEDYANSDRLREMLNFEYGVYVREDGSWYCGIPQGFINNLGIRCN